MFLKRAAVIFAMSTTLAWAENKMVIPAPPAIAGTAHVLIDANSGQVILGSQEHEKRAPASLTKLLTTYIIEDLIEQGKIKETDMVTISENAWRKEGSRSFMDLHSQVSVIDLLRGVIIQSGNDASVALAEHAAGSETAFVDMMNQYAEKLNLKNSHFMNPEGLEDPNHYSTAYDIALLSKAILDDHSQYYKIYAEKEFVYNGIKQGNRNTLLYKDPTVDGLKTGHTEAAGYCLAASALRGGMRLISVVMGTDSFAAREQETAKLLDYGFRYFKTDKIYEANQVLQSSRVWKGVQRNVKLGVGEPLYITYSRDQTPNVQAVIAMNDDLVAPIQVGQSVGKVNVMLGDKPYTTLPLVALENVEQGGFFRRVWDSITLFFHQLMS